MLEALNHLRADLVSKAQLPMLDGHELAMQPGQLISLGSFSPLLPPKAGLKVTASYQGLPGAAPVSVVFK